MLRSIIVLLVVLCFLLKKSIVLTIYSMKKGYCLHLLVTVRWALFWCRSYCIAVLIRISLRILSKQRICLRSHDWQAYAISLTSMLLFSGNVHPNPGPYKLTLSWSQGTSNISQQIAVLNNPADGHCFLHSLHGSLRNNVNIDISQNELIQCIRSELLQYKAFYTDF